MIIIKWALYAWHAFHNASTKLLMQTHKILVLFWTLGVVGVVGVIVADATNFEGPNVPNFIEKPTFFLVSEQSRMSTLSVQKV